MPAHVFRLGTLVGRELGSNADLAFDLRHVRQILKSRNLLTQKKSDPEFNLADARKRLGLMQEQMATALNVTTRTVQNWERAAGAGQLLRKTRDLRELLELMDDYVVASEEGGWLTTPLPALRGQTPKEAIASGRGASGEVLARKLRLGGQAQISLEKYPRIMFAVAVSLSRVVDLRRSPRKGRRIAATILSRPVVGQDSVRP